MIVEDGGVIFCDHVRCTRQYGVCLYQIGSEYEYAVPVCHSMWHGISMVFPLFPVSSMKPARRTFDTNNPEYLELQTS